MAKTLEEDQFAVSDGPGQEGGKKSLVDKGTEGQRGQISGSGQETRTEGVTEIL